MSVGRMGGAEGAAAALRGAVPGQLWRVHGVPGAGPGSGRRGCNGAPAACMARAAHPPCRPAAPPGRTARPPQVCACMLPSPSAVHPSFLQCIANLLGTTSQRSHYARHCAMLCTIEFLSLSLQCLHVVRPLPGVRITDVLI